jgi:hypothetical protein
MVAARSEDQVHQRLTIRKNLRFKGDQVLKPTPCYSKNRDAICSLSPSTIEFHRAIAKELVESGESYAGIGCAPCRVHWQRHRRLWARALDSNGPSPRQQEPVHRSGNGEEVTWRSRDYDTGGGCFSSPARLSSNWRGKSSPQRRGGTISSLPNLTLRRSAPPMR